MNIPDGLDRYPVFLGNLDVVDTNGMVCAILRDIPGVLSVRITTKCGAEQGSALVDFATKEFAGCAIRNLYGKVVNKRTLIVDWSRSLLRGRPNDSYGQQPVDAYPPNWGYQPSYGCPPGYGCPPQYLYAPGYVYPPPPPPPVPLPYCPYPYQYEQLNYAQPVTCGYQPTEMTAQMRQQQEDDTNLGIVASPRMKGC